MGSFEQLIEKWNLPKFPLDGQYHNQDHLWMRGYQVGSAVRVDIGNWRTGEKERLEMRMDESPITDEDRKAWAELDKKIEEDKKALAAKAALECKPIWDGAALTGEHAYLSSKKITELHGSRLSFTKEKLTLIIPLYNKGSLVGLQYIDEEGNKWFHTGSKMKASYFSLGTPGDRILIAEGFATAASIHEATGFGVVCAFNAGNLGSVSKEIKEKYPDKEIVICADDDYQTRGNPGISKAKSTGFKVIQPKWGYHARGVKDTDFNDLHCKLGLAYVKDCIENQLLSDLPVEVPRVGCLIDFSGKTPKEPSDSIVAYAIQKQVGTKWRANEQDVFSWTGKCWEEKSFDEFRRYLQPTITEALGCKFSEAKSRAIISLLTKNVLQKMGDDVYNGNVTATSFRNGTLRLQARGSKRSLTFEKSYDPEDMLLTTLPFDLDVDAPEPTLLLSWLRECLLRNSPELDEQILLIQEIMGSCLAPFYPVLVFFAGKPKTGKSTLVKLIASLLSESNISRVDPTKFHGFGMETMVGKHVNILTDLNVTDPIDIEVVKQVEDRVPITIQRKFRTDLRSHIPAVHLFATNALPRIKGDTSGAIERRVRVFQCNEEIQGKTEPDYHLKFIDQEQSKIVAWAYRGLVRVVENGGYTYPESLKSNAKNWSHREDRVENFISDLKEDGIPDLVISPEGVAKRTILRKAYIEWSREMGINRISTEDLGRLYDKFKGKMVHGERLVVGVSERKDF